MRLGLASLVILGGVALVVWKQSDRNEQTQDNER